MDALLDKALQHMIAEPPFLTNTVDIWSSVFSVSQLKVVCCHLYGEDNTHNSFEAAAWAPKMASSDTVLKSKPANCIKIRNQLLVAK